MAELTTEQLLTRFTDGIKQARAATKLLAFAQQSEHWLNIEKALEHTAAVSGRILTRSKIKVVK